MHHKEVMLQERRDSVSLADRSSAAILHTPSAARAILSARLRRH